jgi:hypothetical protein
MTDSNHCRQRITFQPDGRRATKSPTVSLRLLTGLPEGD